MQIMDAVVSRTLIQLINLINLKQFNFLSRMLAMRKAILNFLQNDTIEHNDFFIHYNIINI